eukprot:4306162-Pyramimonas_sp.AAC.1
MPNPRYPPSSSSIVPPWEYITFAQPLRQGKGGRMDGRDMRMMEHEKVAGRWLGTESTWQNQTGRSG